MKELLWQYKYNRRARKGERRRNISGLAGLAKEVAGEEKEGKRRTTKRASWIAEHAFHPTSFYCSFSFSCYHHPRKLNSTFALLACLLARFDNTLRAWNVLCEKEKASQSHNCTKENNKRFKLYFLLLPFFVLFSSFR